MHTGPEWLSPVGNWFYNPTILLCKYHSVWSNNILSFILPLLLFAFHACLGINKSLELSLLNDYSIFFTNPIVRHKTMMCRLLILSRVTCLATWGLPLEFAISFLQPLYIASATKYFFLQTFQRKWSQNWCRNIKRGDSNEYPQHMFLWRPTTYKATLMSTQILMGTHNIRFYGEITKIILKYPLYLFHWVM